MTSEALPVRQYTANEKPTLTGEIRDLIDYHHLLANLVRRDVIIRYKRSILGVVWTMVNPLLTMVILTIVFSTVFRFAIDHYEIYFLSEFLAWTFFAQSSVQAATSMSWNGPLLKRVRVPKSIFAIATTISGLVNLVLSLVPLFLIMIWKDAPFSAALFVLPVSFLIVSVFTLGICLILSTLSVYFADVREMYQIILTALMYLTPIFYPIAIVPENFLWFVKINPLLHVFEIVRTPIYEGMLPTGAEIGIASAIAASSLALGWLVFKRLSPHFYPHL